MLTVSDLSTKLNEGNYRSSKDVLPFLLASFKGGFPDREGHNTIVTLPSTSRGGGREKEHYGLRRWGMESDSPIDSYVYK